MHSGIIDIMISDHFMIYRNKKILKEKYSKHKDLTFRLPKNYSVDVYEETLKKY